MKPYPLSVVRSRAERKLGFAAVYTAAGGPGEGRIGTEIGPGPISRVRWSAALPWTRFPREPPIAVPTFPTTVLATFARPGRHRAELPPSRSFSRPPSRRGHSGGLRRPGVQDGKGCPATPAPLSRPGIVPGSVSEGRSLIRPFATTRAPRAGGTGYVCLGTNLVARFQPQGLLPMGTGGRGGGRKGRGAVPRAQRGSSSRSTPPIPEEDSCPPPAPPKGSVCLRRALT